MEDIDAPLVTAFLDDLEASRGITARTRNLRLTAVHSFFRFASYEAPTHAAQIARVLAIPAKKFTRALVPFLSRPEVDALLAAPDSRTWSGRRDHAQMLVAGSHVRVVGKGRKERCTPLSKASRAVMAAWLREPPRAPDQPVFPNARGGPLSAHGVQYLVAKHVATASRACTSLARKRVSPHVLRHATAMDLMHEGVERSVLALWFGHESVETTQIYLDADLEMKSKLLDKLTPPDSKPGRYRPDDALLAFLKSL